MRSASMRSVFVDTSAFYAILDRDDLNHAAAARTWNALLDAGDSLLTTNYIVLETCALLQNRIGLDAVRTFCQDILPVTETHWITAEIHQLAIQTVLAANRRKLSLVDCTSFAVMRTEGIRYALAFDQHFNQQGFDSPL